LKSSIDAKAAAANSERIGLWLLANPPSQRAVTLQRYFERGIAQQPFKCFMPILG